MVQIQNKNFEFHHMKFTNKQLKTKRSPLFRSLHRNVRANGEIVDITKLFLQVIRGLLHLALAHRYDTAIIPFAVI